MNADARRKVNPGFTLIELLTVIAILTILAAMLLPALGQAKARAQRTACISQLREIGLAFHLFANDHQGRLPMQVPSGEGGSADAVPAARSVDGDFHFAYPHFKALANELGNPRILVCPADTRRPTSNFGNLQNENLSYFVNTAAEHGKSVSILAGDRNLTNDWAEVGSNFRLDANSMLRWTSELHRFRGNLLFGDAHVEERGRSALIISSSTPAVASLNFPAAMPPNGAGRPPLATPKPTIAEKLENPTAPEAASGNHTPRPEAKEKWGQPTGYKSARVSPSTRSAGDSSIIQSAPAPAKTSAGAPTNVPASRAQATAETSESGQSMFDVQFVEFLQSLMGWTYLLLLLLLVIYLSVRLWLWLRERQAHKSRAASRWD